MATCPCPCPRLLLCIFALFATASVSGAATLGAASALAESLNATKSVPTVDNATSSVFSFAENIKKITESVKGLYSSAFSSNYTSLNTSTAKANTILGEKCENSTECSAVEFATCDKGMCFCDSNHTVSSQENDRCLRVVNLGEDCKEDVQCSKGDPGSICVEMKCACSVNYSEKEGKCIPKTKIGSACLANADCQQIPFAECIDKLCGCADPLLPSKHLNVCLTVASPAERAPCQEDIQCSAQYGDRSRCLEGYCECDHAFHAFSGKCIPDLQLGSTCNKSLDCIVSRHTEEGNIRECFNNTCTCAVGYKSTIEENFCVKAGEGYQLHASLAWLLCIFVLPYIF